MTFEDYCEQIRSIPLTGEQAHAANVLIEAIKADGRTLRLFKTVGGGSTTVMVLVEQYMKMNYDAHNKTTNRPPENA